jgi:hypothetical protein
MTRKAVRRGRHPLLQLMATSLIALAFLPQSITLAAGALMGWAEISLIIAHRATASIAAADQRRHHQPARILAEAILAGS